ncbi:MAG TPA: group III truncated hemoglobin [Hyphomicrobium sp.]|nr:group III truncated hemoglobin [Hyphomicrobium sp.]
MSVAFGRTGLSPGQAVGIDAALIAAVVDAFYARVREDEMLGSIFEEAVSDWPSHLQRLRMFWMSVVLMTGDYKGQPLRAHFGLPLLTDEHFQRWLDLFQTTVDALCSPSQAEVFMVRAYRIADSFRFGLAAHRGEVAQPLSR